MRLAVLKPQRNVPNQVVLTKIVRFRWSNATARLYMSHVISYFKFVTTHISIPFEVEIFGAIHTSGCQNYFNYSSLIHAHMYTK